MWKFTSFNHFFTSYITITAWGFYTLSIVYSYLCCGQKGHADFADNAIFLLCSSLVPQISRIFTDFLWVSWWFREKLRLGISILVLIWFFIWLIDVKWLLLQWCIASSLLMLSIFWDMQYGVERILTMGVKFFEPPSFLLPRRTP